MKRRTFLLGVGASALAGAAGITAVQRLHSLPRREPFLTGAYLTALTKADFSHPRVLIVGNSMVLNHDLPILIEERAAQEGIRLSVATAAAHGARLVETFRIKDFRALLRPGYWDALVLQDFTKTPLRQVDRWGSAFAIHRIASAVRPTPIVLFPPFPAAEGNSVYRDAGLFSTTPKNPKDYALRTMAHYSKIASQEGLIAAPVPERWLAAGTPNFYAPDGHHASATGTRFIADQLWPVIYNVLE